MFEFVSSLSWIGKFILILSIIILICSIFAECIFCDYVPIKFVKNENFKLHKDIVALFSSDKQFENFENDELEEQEDFINVENPKLIYFSSPYCGYCDKYNPIWEQLVISLKEKYPNVNFVKINSVENKETAKEYNIQAFPTILYENKNGKRITFEGDRNELNELAEFINNN
jgi:thiol-disulfide isomerase/thioredoxin